jgi:mRNA-degrading endonuclease RelE of RelBE toxin-antitoxin system
VSGNLPTAKQAYKIEVEDEAWKGLSSLPQSAQEKVTALWRDHLSHTPTQRIPGKLKALRGEYKGYYQFEITKDARMIYFVDEEARVVYVEYIGKHPDWKRHRKRAF